jgi:hypothetical protein
MQYAVCGMRRAQGTHTRYATVREGSWLKGSDSMRRESMCQLIRAGSLGQTIENVLSYHLDCGEMRKGRDTEQWRWGNYEARAQGCGKRGLGMASRPARLH